MVYPHAAETRLLPAQLFSVINLFYDPLSPNGSFLLRGAKIRAVVGICGSELVVLRATTEGQLFAVGGGVSLRLPRLLLHACGSILSIGTVSRSPASSELSGGRARPHRLDGCWGLAGRCGGLFSQPPGMLGMCSGEGLSQIQAFSHSACADSCSLGFVVCFLQDKAGGL